MVLFKKKMKGVVKTIHKVKIGHREICFSSREDALAIYNALSISPFFSLESKMIYDAVAKDKDGSRPYNFYHFIDKMKTVSLEAEEVTVYGKDEVEKLDEARDEELEKIDAKKKKKS